MQAGFEWVATSFQKSRIETTAYRESVFVIGEQTDEELIYSLIV